MKVPAIVPLMFACAAVTLCVGEDAPAGKETPVAPATAEKAALPAIDLAAPAAVETATFAVG